MKINRFKWCLSFLYLLLWIMPHKMRRKVRENHDFLPRNKFYRKEELRNEITCYIYNFGVADLKTSSDSIFDLFLYVVFQLFLIKAKENMLLVVACRSFQSELTWKIRMEPPYNWRPKFSKSDMEFEFWTLLVCKRFFYKNKIVLGDLKVCFPTL